jgi:hypothetical protein
MSIGVLLTLVCAFVPCGAARLFSKAVTWENGTGPSARACITCAVMRRALNPPGVHSGRRLGMLELGEGQRVQCRDALLLFEVVHA